VRVTESVEIRRPPADVFAFLADLSNLPRWQPSVKEVSGRADAGIGGRVVETREFMGKRVRSTLEVTAFDPGSELSLRVVEGPVALAVRHLLEPTGDGTRVTLDAEVDAARRLRFGAARIAARAAGHQAKQDLDRLKRLLESA
jgi:carbon monoxide dehydrogenase subunit G